jgi:hypothetical protein
MKVTSKNTFNRQTFKFSVGVFFISILNISMAAEQPSPETTEPQKAKPTSKIITIETKVKGSSEQPKILTLVPWQSPKAPVGLYIPMTQTLPTNVFQPVSKDSLDRLIKIYQPVIPIPVKNKD